LIHFACWINKGTNTHSEFVIHFLQKIFSWPRLIVTLRVHCPSYILV
jgi:hypothetical protein